MIGLLVCSIFELLASLGFESYGIYMLANHVTFNLLGLVTFVIIYTSLCGLCFVFSIISVVMSCKITKARMIVILVFALLSLGIAAGVGEIFAYERDMLIGILTGVLIGLPSLALIVLSSIAIHRLRKESQAKELFMAAPSPIMQSYYQYPLQGYYQQQQQPAQPMMQQQYQPTMQQQQYQPTYYQMPAAN